ncbi:MAG: hypothetical protein LBR07_03385 [Puniceicoccales bacterium]|jgi:biopolymer transport protein ExbD|nr:hypothetical protein [Puniceicoccales bacterium]
MRLLSRLPLNLLAIAAAGLAFTGCADSPFKISKRLNPDSVIVTIDPNNRVTVDYNDIEPALLSSKLNNIGAASPGRDISLVVYAGTDPRAVNYVKEQAKNAGLGKVDVIDRDELRGTYRSRPTEESDKARAAARKAEAEKTAVADAAKPPAPVAEPPAPEQPPAPVTPAPTPVAVTEPAPTPVAPASGVVVPVVALATGSYSVDGSVLPASSLGAAFNALAATKAGAVIEIAREPGTEITVILEIKRAARAAGFTRFENKR